MNLGFMLDAAAFAAVRQAPGEWTTAYHNQVIPHLRKRLGADRNYRPIYPNFPTEVMAMSNLSLFINAFVHYLSDGRWEPPHELKDRGIAFEKTEFRTIRVGTDEQFRQVFTALVSINQSLTEQDKEIVAWFVEHEPHLVLPAQIPFKETLCILAAKSLDVPVKTPTDVLRIAVYLSGGDISLPGVPQFKPVAAPQPNWWQRVLGYQANARWQECLENQRIAQQQARDKFKFRKFNRSQRRYLLGLLEKTGADAVEMKRHLGRWLRLGEILHVGEFAGRFPRCAEAYQVLRNLSKDHKLRTFAGNVDLAFKEDWRKGVELLGTRPGEFARRLDWMLRKFDQGEILAAFARIGTGVSSKVLFELRDHFSSRAKPGAPRVVMLKGKRAKMKTLPALPPLDAHLVQRVGDTILSLITDRIAKLPPLGRVWIDERLKEVPLPFAMRSVNTAVKTYVRGTRIAYNPAAKVIRPFLHWYDEQGSIDLDLSVGLYNFELAQVSHISYTNLKDPHLNCCHSGDIRHRQGPCAEYVDIDIQQCLAKGVRYAMVQAFNFDANPMHTVKDCVFGLMEREHAEAGEIFIPKTISNCMALANEGTSVIVCIVDLQTSQYIWADLEADRVFATLENTASQTTEVLKALLQGTKMSIHDLLVLHAQARGTLVVDAASADALYKWEDFVTDYARAAAFMTI